MKLTVKVIEPAYIKNVWPHVKHYIEEALEVGQQGPEELRDYGPDHILMYLASGQMMLIVGTNEANELKGAMTVSFIDYPKHRVAFITTFGGYLVSDKDNFVQVKSILKTYGATKLQAYCRDSMVRYLKRFGFEPRNTLVETTV